MADRDTDMLFMQRAITLATVGLGHVSPNPMVGCVIVRENRIIGESWHKRYGEAHAEVNAVNAVDNKELILHSTVFVNLEPCSHYGKTPPCADMLIGQKIGRVVVSNLDSNPLVAGEGVHRMREAGISVTVGVCEKEGKELNKRFFTCMELNRPYIILKWAETLDGFMAREDHQSKWISNEYSRKLVHKWRSEEDAVLVGSQTASYDNPSLNVRDWHGRNPVRIVIDRFLKLDCGLNLFDQSQRTLCYNTVRTGEQENLVFVKLGETDFLEDLVEDLFDREIQSVMVEGGPGTLQMFIDSGLWDEARVFVADKEFKKGIAAPELKGFLQSEEGIMGDMLRVSYRSGEGVDNGKR